ncbi:hypothetical protein EUGRSUZ_K01641 [Eucalyptus grandis]|uniref:Uncharacterized protein n=2 Tax=Eucalyptus grandis TaxID=71139 RepID=A0ACC3ITZ1_EUCGR|nr:hypothetical protein EUGRSUZ_K01641 [Eucalyptus grandis]
MLDEEDHRETGGFDGQVLQREVRRAPGPPGDIAPGAAAAPAAPTAAPGAGAPRARPHHVGPHPPRLLALPIDQRHCYFPLISILQTTITDRSRNPPALFRSIVFRFARPKPYHRTLCSGWKRKIAWSRRIAAEERAKACPKLKDGETQIGR